MKWVSVILSLIGGAVAIWMMNGCGTPIGEIGKADVAKLIDETQELIAWFASMPDIVSPKKPAGEAPVKFKDDIAIEDITFHGKRNPSADLVTHDLQFEGKFGGQVRLIQTATKEWPLPKGFDVIGTVWILIPKGFGKWDGYQTDYIRPGQTLRHWPWADKKRDLSYPPVKKGDSFGVVLTTLARDWRTNPGPNGDMRTKTVKVQ